MFGHAARFCRTYEFGCPSWADPGRAAIDVMRARVRLWNALVDIDHTAREARRTLVRSYSPALAAAEAAFETGVLAKAEALRSWERAGHAKDEPLPAEQAAVLNAAITAARAAIKPLRDAVYGQPEVTAAVAALDAERHAAILAAITPAASGLHWLQSDDVRATYETARKRPGALQFHAWRRQVGEISVRWQIGLPMARVWGDDTRLQLAPLMDTRRAYDRPRDDEGHHLSRRRDWREAARSVLQIRIGSDAQRQPVWATVPIVLHRPLPPEGLLRSAALRREVLGNGTTRYKAIFVVELPAAPPETMNTGGTIAVDVGWRHLPGGVGTRVASWRDEHGRGGTVVLPQSWLNQMATTEDLREIRDRHFNDARLRLLTWLTDPAQRPEAPEVPDGLLGAAANLGQWHAPERLSALVWQWSRSRFPGDESMFVGAAGGEWGEHYGAGLAGWRRKERHLHAAEDHLRDQLLHLRREQYRLVAAEWSRKYSRVVLEQFDLRTMARVKRYRDGTRPEGAELPAAARHYRVWAAVSEFRQVLESGCRHRGVPVEKRAAMDTTRQCPVCGATAPFDAAAILAPTCVNGHTMDQDERAARNLLARSQQDAAGG